MGLGTILRVGFDALQVRAGLAGLSRMFGGAMRGFRQVGIGAARQVGAKMTDTIGKLLTALPEGWKEAADWAGDMTDMSNQTGVADIRIRPRWDEWSANLRVRFDREQMSDEDIINLLVRAGLQCGICEGRPDSSNSFGLGWGLFEIDTTKPIELREVPAPQIQFVRS